MKSDRKTVITLIQDTSGERQSEMITDTDRPAELPRLNLCGRSFLGWNKYKKLGYGFMSIVPHYDETLYAISTDAPAYIIESGFIGDTKNYTEQRSQFRRYTVNIYLENAVASSGNLKLNNCNNILYYLGHIPVEGISAEVVTDTDTRGGAYIDAAYYTTSEIEINWRSEKEIDSRSSRCKIAQIMLTFSRFGLGYNEIKRRTSDDIIIPSHGHKASVDGKQAYVSANFYMGVTPYPEYPKVRDDKNVISAQCADELPKMDRGELLSRFAVLADSHVGLRYNWESYDWLYNTYSKIGDIHKSTPLDFVLQLGDNIDDGYKGSYETDYKIYLETVKKLEICNPNDPMSTTGGMIPNYELQGNHDTSMDTRFFRNKLWYSVNSSGKRVAYVAFFVTYGGYPAVNYDIAGNYNSYRSYGIIEDDTIKFIEESIKEAIKNNAASIVLCSHWGIAQDLIAPILPETGLGKIEAICQRYGIKLYLNGHEHNIPYTLRKYNEVYNYDASMTKDKYAVFEIWEKCIVASIYDTNTQKISRVDMIQL